MNDKERVQQLTEVHVYLAIKRKKDNKGADGKKIYRQIIYNDNTDLSLVKTKCNTEKGQWRIYKTVNKRNILTAKRKFIHTLIDTKRTDIESLWRKELLQPEHRVGRRLLIDIDTNDKQIQDKIKEEIIKVTPIIEEIDTPSGGKHLITEGFDSREVRNKYKDYFEILKDGYIFIELYMVE